MSRVVIVMLGALVSAAAAAGLTGQTQAPLIVAYMTSDGELVPIARYDGAGWRNTWPEPIDNGAPLPVRLVSEIPRAGSVSVFRRRGRRGPGRRGSSSASR